MREILFRGRDPDTGRWYEGFYMALSETTYCFKEDYDSHHENTKHYIVFDRMTDWGLPNQHLRADIDPSTLGQFTGLLDKNGKRIFEGDILLLDGEDGYFKLEFDEVTARFIMIGDIIQVDFDNFYSIEVDVVGNIYDNPEILEED